MKTQQRRPAGVATKLSKKEAKIAAAIARAHLSAMFGNGSSEIDYHIFSFLTAWHADEGRKAGNTDYRTRRDQSVHEWMSEWTYLRLQPLALILIDSLANLNPKPLKRLAEALQRTRKRCSGTGNDFNFQWAKPKTLEAHYAAQTVPRDASDRVKAPPGSKSAESFEEGLSAEDLYQYLAKLRDGSPNLSDRQCGRILRLHQIEPKNKGGYRTRRD